MYNRHRPNIDLSSVNAESRLVSFRKMDETTYQACLHRPTNVIDTAAIADEILELTGSRLITVPESIFRIKPNVVSVVLTSSVHIKSMDQASAMTPIGNNYADTAGQLWSVVDSDSGRHLVRETDDDLAEILSSLVDTASSHGITGYMASLDAKANHGDVAGIVIGGKVKFGFILDDLLVDTNNSTVERFDKANVFFATAGRIVPPSITKTENPMDTAKLSKSEKDIILEFFKSYYPEDFIAKLRKMMNG